MCFHEENKSSWYRHSTLHEMFTSGYKTSRADHFCVNCQHKDNVAEIAKEKTGSSVIFHVLAHSNLVKGTESRLSLDSLSTEGRVPVQISLYTSVWKSVNLRSVQWVHRKWKLYYDSKDQIEFNCSRWWSRGGIRNYTVNTVVSLTCNLSCSYFLEQDHRTDHYPLV